MRQVAGGTRHLLRSEPGHEVANLCALSTYLSLPPFACGLVEQRRKRYLEWENAKEKGLSAMEDSRTVVLSRDFFDRYTRDVAETFHHVQKSGLCGGHVVLDKKHVSSKLHGSRALVEIGKLQKCCLWIS
jgi:hypothetical protein